MQHLLNEIHDKAWGKSWPAKPFSIRRSEIFPNEAEASDDDDDIPPEFTFTVLSEMDLLIDAFGIPTRESSVMVILKEYEFLRNVLEELKEDVKATGQPGTGKTVFLLHLLLHRLEHKRPTAVQFLRESYVVFKSDGAFLSPTRTDGSIDHEDMLPTGCWCLVDGNRNVDQPCQPFSRRDLRTFLITSPNPGGYKKWVSQLRPTTVITDLPRTIEVAAIAMMHGWEPRDAIAIVRKWGPCTRTVLSILKNQRQEEELGHHVVRAAIDIRNDPSVVTLYNTGQRPSGEGSALLFIQPIRSKSNPSYCDSKAIIPTMHLSEIFDSNCENLSAPNRMRLHDVIAMGSMTSVADQQHRKNMHLQMMSVVHRRYEIFNDTAKSEMNTSTTVLLGTQSALRAATSLNRLSSFYWFPSFVRFPGIDSILVSGNNIYALQATIADIHEGSRNGLIKAWHTIGAEHAHNFTWHFVVVTNNKPLQDKYAKEIGTHLHDITLGCHPNYTKVSVWVCTLGVQPR